MKVKELVKTLSEYPKQDDEVVICLAPNYDWCVEIDLVDTDGVSEPTRVEINTKEEK